MFIKNYINFLNEHVINTEIDLLKYLKMTDVQKAKDIVYNNLELFREFLIYCEDDLTDDEMSLRDDIIDNELNSYDELNINIEDLSTSLLTRFIKWYYKYGILDVYDEERLSWEYFEDAKIIKKQWLIHLTHDKDVTNIYKEGFKFGTPEREHLGITYGNIKGESGFNFAYTLDDFLKYGIKSHISKGFKYGQNIILFKSSGIRAWHNSDNEYQVIFDGSKAEDISLIEYDDVNDLYFISSNINNQVLVKNNSLKKIVYWIETNYQQYYKHIFRKSNINKK